MPRSGEMSANARRFSILCFMEVQVASLRVFVSHSHKDNGWCEGFVAGLKHCGLDVWYDREGLYVGAEWVKTLEKELQGRDIYLIVLTPDSWASEWVQRELSLALGQQKRIIGVLCKPTQVSGFLTNYQLLDATQTGAWEAAQLVAAALNSSKPTTLTQQPSLQTLQVASGTSAIDVSGEWVESGGFHLYLSQVGTVITGTGKRHSPILGVSPTNLTITGSINSSNLRLKAKRVGGKPLDLDSRYVKATSYYDLHLILVSPGKLKGHVVRYRHNLLHITSAADTANLTLLRQDE